MFNPIGKLLTAERKQSLRKLSKEQMELIKQDTRSYKKIAADYGVSAQTVCNIKRKY